MFILKERGRALAIAETAESAMDEHTMAQIFELILFHQRGRYRLGLAVSYGIVLGHGGGNTCGEPARSGQPIHGVASLTPANSSS